MGLSSSPIYDQLPSAVRRERNGQNAVERLAITVVRREIAAMPASLVVQLALWPAEIAGWAREIRASESLVYNMLAGRKPYVRTRQLLAERLDASIGVVDHLIEARRATPSTQRGPLDPVAENPVGPIDWTRPPYERRRDGTNPIERRAVRVVEVDVASMAAATVVGLAMWPESLSAWSRAERFKSSVVWATLAGSPSVPVRDALARRLGVSLRELDALVTEARAASVAYRLPNTAAAPEREVSLATSTAPDADIPRDATPHDAPRRDASLNDAEQLGFGF
jgi:hypothetical protein